MPSRNVIKVDLPNAYYHVYARGNSRSEIFLDEQDHTVFLNLFKRYLSSARQKDPNGVPYPHLWGKIELISYCLMPNHFHLLVYQQASGAMARLMRSILTSYSRYFNTKYTRSGPLFESRYKASFIYNQQYLEHITRYIHLNPHNWRYYRYSSLSYYLGIHHAEWLHPDRVLLMFKSGHDYLAFLEDYEGHKQALLNLKAELANNITT